MTTTPDTRIFGLVPRSAARLCGALYLYIVVMGIFTELFVRGGLVVGGDPAATAANIQGHEALFRFGFSGELLQFAFDVAIAAILYGLFRTVDPALALFAALSRIACGFVLSVASLVHFAALKLLAGGPALAAFTPEQLQALALFAMRLHGDGYAISLVFFGFACLALGSLILRSALLPRALGVLMALAGLCYLVSSFVHFLAPQHAGALFPAAFVIPFVAETGLGLWLLAKGVR